MPGYLLRTRRVTCRSWYKNIKYTHTTDPKHTAPYTCDALTLGDPIRRPFVRQQQLEDPKGGGLCVVGTNGQTVQAFMEPKELKNMSENFLPSKTPAYRATSRSGAHEASTAQSNCVVRLRHSSWAYG